MKTIAFNQVLFDVFQSQLIQMKCVFYVQQISRLEKGHIIK